jgi:hypothetical protein
MEHEGQYYYYPTVSNAYVLSSAHHLFLQKQYFHKIHSSQQGVKQLRSIYLLTNRYLMKNKLSSPSPTNMYPSPQKKVSVKLELLKRLHCLSLHLGHEERKISIDIDRKEESPSWSLNVQCFTY